MEIQGVVTLHSVFLAALSAFRILAPTVRQPHLRQVVPSPLTDPRSRRRLRGLAQALLGHGPPELRGRHVAAHEQRHAPQQHRRAHG